MLAVTVVALLAGRLALHEPDAGPRVLMMAAVLLGWLAVLVLSWRRIAAMAAARPAPRAGSGPSPHWP